MEKVFAWKRSTWSGIYKILEDKNIRGQLKFSSSLRNASGKLNDTLCTFRSRGFFSYVTEITDENTGQETGRIEYNLTMSKATIYLNGKQYDCSAKNSIPVKSKTFSSGDTEVSLKGYSSKGKIATNTNDNMLIICSFFATHFCWKMVTISFIVAFFPILLLILGIIS